MKVVQFDAFGSPAVLKVVDRPDPEIKGDELLIKIKSAGVNPVDYKLRKAAFPGAFLFRFKLPFVPGGEFSGEVLKAGAQTMGFAPGDKVMGFGSALQGGAYAERIAIRADCCVKIGGSADLLAAGGTPLAALTAYQLFKDLKLDGKEMLVLGASGGVGHFAVQIGKLLGARVTGVASSRNQAFIKETGAHEALAYDAPDYAIQADRYDIYFDAIASQSPSSVAKYLKKGGAFLSTIFNPLQLAQAVFRGLTYKAAFVKSNPQDLKLLAGWLEKGQVRAHIEKTYTLNEATQAHVASESGRTRGKLVILP